MDAKFRQNDDKKICEKGLTNPLNGDIIGLQRLRDPSAQIHKTMTVYKTREDKNNEKSNDEDLRSWC